MGTMQRERRKMRRRKLLMGVSSSAHALRPGPRGQGTLCPPHVRKQDRELFARELWLPNCSDSSIKKGLLTDEFLLIDLKISIALYL